MNTDEPIGLLAAMPEEIFALLRDIEGLGVVTRAGRAFHSGVLCGRRVVAVFSRWGKVAAASTTTELIIGHGVSNIIFSGIAGGLKGVARGDVVVADQLVQHDLDASPYFAPTHVPMLGIAEMPTDPALRNALHTAAAAFLKSDLRAAAGEVMWARAGLAAPRAHIGTIASGDQVVFSEDARQRVLRAVPGALCVEMEGAAAAQVCFEHGVPFACVRTISDDADGSGHEHIKPFFDGLAGVYTRGILRRMLSSMP